jgi:hypothetical protein
MTTTMTALPDAPLLGLPHVARELEDLHRDKHRTRRSCIFGILDGATPDGPSMVTAFVDGSKVPFRVREVHSELELRLFLDGDTSEDVVYLVPFARRLPRDLASHFARGSVWWPRAEHQLPRRFGARNATPRLLGSQLARLIRFDGSRDYAATTTNVAGSVDLDEAWLLFLQTHLGAVPGQLTGARLFELVLLDGETRGARMAGLLEKQPEARRELLQTVERVAGIAGPVLVSAWLDGRADLLGAAALVGEATRTTLQGAGSGERKTLLTVLEVAFKTTPGHPLRAVLEAGTTETLAQVLLALGGFVPLTWPVLRRDRPGDTQALLKLAEQLLMTEEARAVATDSHRLPFTFEHRIQLMVSSLTTHALGATTTTMAGVRAAATALLRHEWSSEHLQGVVHNAERLAAFLLQAPPPSTDDPSAELSSLARFQVDDGGWADWVRQDLRGHDAGKLRPGVLAILDKADAIVDDLHARFGAAYARLADHKGGRKNLKNVTLIEDALQAGGLNVLGQTPDVRFLILCMDGMSWANLAELWQRPNSRLANFVPLVPTSSPTARPAPVVAVVPTITNLSRTALFLGRELKPGDGTDTGKDGERLATNLAACQLGAPPTLWLKRDLVAPAGDLNADLKKLITSPDPVVGVVVNAIDEHLKGAAQLRVELTVAAIPVLHALLDVAETAGRAVLLCSDHGNMSSQRFGTTATATKGAEGGSRWRWLLDGEVSRPHEVVVPSGALNPPMPGARPAIPCDEKTTYGVQRHAGEHGGLSLSEAIAPLLLLAPAAVVGDLVQDRKLFQRARFEPPTWWSGDIDAVPAATGTPAKAPPDGTSLFPLDLVSKVIGSKLFKAMCDGKKKDDIEKVRRGLSLLIDAGGRMGRDGFGKGLSMTLTTRVPGFVGTMASFLNVEQEAVVQMDPKQTMVELDIALLERLFVETP